MGRKESNQTNKDPWRLQETLLYSVVWHYHQSYVQHYMANLMLAQCVIASYAEVWTCPILVEILSGDDSIHGTGPRRKGSVNSRSTLCPIERRSCWPKTLLSALIWLITLCKLDNFFLTSQASNLYSLLAFYVKDRFSPTSESMESSTAFLPMSPASIRSLAMPGLAGTPKDKKYTKKKLPLLLVLLCIWADWIFDFSALKSCFNILSSDVMSNSPFHL